MRYAGGVLLVLLLVIQVPGAEDSEPIRAGKISRRNLPGGLAYAVYAPKTWRKRQAVPVVVHAALPRQIPYARLQNSVLPQEADHAARSGFRALHAMVLLEAPNKENTASSPGVDRERYVQLLERDVGHVAAVLEDLAAEVRIRRDAVFIRGIRYSAEAALGIAMRKPEVFAGAMAMEMQCSTINWVDDAYALPWSALPEGDARTTALGLSIFLTHLRGEGDTERKARKVTLMQALLRAQGFRRVEAVTRSADSDSGYFLTPEGWAWLAGIADARKARTRKRAERDVLLANARREVEKGRIAPALRHLEEATKLEDAHDLTSASSALYDVLEEKGREMRSAADALPAAKRKAAYRKMAKLFAGTAFGDEVAKALEAMP